MSDFGTLLTARKKNDQAITSEETSSLKEALVRILSAGEFENALGEPFNAEFVPVEGTRIEVQAQLSGHFYGAGVEADEKLEDFNFVEDLEAGQADDIREKLEEQFPEWEFEAEVAEW